MTKLVSLTAVLLVVGLVTWTLGFWSDRQDAALSDAALDAPGPSFSTDASPGTFRHSAAASAQASPSRTPDAPRLSTGSTRAAREVFAEDVIARRAMSGKTAKAPLTSDDHAN